MDTACADVRQEFSRGFNQAQEIALRLSRNTEIPILTGFLARDRDTPTQSRLDRQQRLKNLRGAFRGSQLPGSALASVGFRMVWSPPGGQD